MSTISASSDPMNTESLERLARFNETVEELGTLLAEIR